MTKTGRIYKIIPNEGNEIYVGSTFNRLSDRFRRHKIDYKQWKLGKKDGCSVFELFDKYEVDKCEIMLIKEYEVVDREHLEMYETLWIYKMKSVNKLMPFGKGIKELEKRKMRLYCAQYYQTNKERLDKKKKEYYEATKDRFAQHYKEYNKKRNSQRVKCPICDTIMNRSRIHIYIYFFYCLIEYYRITSANQKHPIVQHKGSYDNLTIKSTSSGNL